MKELTKKGDAQPAGIGVPQLRPTRTREKLA
jgi:hypothetical protein